MINNTFFDAIGTADMERVHSAIIGWILSDKCKVLNMSDKSRLLNALFDVNDIKDYDEINSILEYNHIDIYVETKHNSKVEKWLIENKIKSSQGNSQLDEYTKLIPDAHYLLLSLIKEDPKNNKWGKKTYKELSDSISNILDDIPKPCSDENFRQLAILEEYANTIKTLCNLVERFIEKPFEYDNVFTDGHKKKSEKRLDYKGVKNGDVKEYIAINNLETILQKLYFTHIKESIQGEIEEYICNRDIKWLISETHGNAEIVIILTPNEEDKLQFDLAFQNGVFKFAVSKNYNTKGIDPKFKEEWISAFEKIANNEKINNGYTKLNRPKSRSRVAISKTFNIDDNPTKKWWEYKIDEVAGAIKKEFIKIIYFEEVARKVVNTEI